MTVRKGACKQHGLSDRLPTRKDDSKKGCLQERLSLKSAACRRGCRQERMLVSARKDACICKKGCLYLQERMLVSGASARVMITLLCESAAAALLTRYRAAVS